MGTPSKKDPQASIRDSLLILVPSKEILDGKEFAAFLEKIATHDVPDTARKIKDWAVENPKTATAVAAGAILIIVPGVVTPILTVAGFGTKGITAGSAAASAQSLVGSIAAGSPIAILESGSNGIIVVKGVAKGAGAVIEGVAGLQAWLAERKKQEEAEKVEAMKDEEEIKEKTGKWPPKSKL